MTYKTKYNTRYKLNKKYNEYRLSFNDNELYSKVNNYVKSYKYIEYTCILLIVRLKNIIYNHINKN